MGPDLIVPRGVENRVAIDMVVEHVKRTLKEKSRKHQEHLQRLGEQVEDEPLSDNVVLLQQTKQVIGMSTIIQNPATQEVDFIFYFDRLASLLVERALENLHFSPWKVATPQNKEYQGLKWAGEISAVIILRGGSCLETGLRRVIPECKSGRVLIQTNDRTGEPELHYLKLPTDMAAHDGVLLLDPQMSSGGAALMAVRVLVDHGVSEERIVFVTYFAGKVGVNRLINVFPKVKVVVARIVEDCQERWVEKRAINLAG
ncbi:Uridine kinase [Lecanora helva]